MRARVPGFLAAVCWIGCGGTTKPPAPLEEVKLEAPAPPPADAPSDPSTAALAPGGESVAAPPSDDTPQPLPSSADQSPSGPTPLEDDSAPPAMAPFLGRYAFAWAGKKAAVKGEAPPQVVYTLQGRYADGAYTATVSANGHQTHEELECRGELRGETMALKVVRCPSEEGGVCRDRWREGAHVLDLKRTRGGPAATSGGLLLQFRALKSPDGKTKELRAEPAD